MVACLVAARTGVWPGDPRPPTCLPATAHPIVFGCGARLSACRAYGADSRRLRRRQLCTVSSATRRKPDISVFNWIPVAAGTVKEWLGWRA